MYNCLGFYIRDHFFFNLLLLMISKPSTTNTIFFTYTLADSFFIISVKLSDLIDLSVSHVIDSIEIYSFNASICYDCFLFVFRKRNESRRFLSQVSERL